MYEDIKEQFKKVIQFSQDLREPLIEELFEQWAQNKSKFIERFDNQLIYEYPFPVEFNLEEKEKERKVMKFADAVAQSYDNRDLALFIDKNRKHFFENKISETLDKNIPKGIKLIKAFKYFVEDKVILRDLQDKASMLIQEDKIVGKLCFSVHPLDFLSLSENAHSWRSCHSLDGDYRAGNLSYMIDNCTFITYIKSENDNNTLPHFGEVKWNSKKWRMLIHTSKEDDIIFAGRQYPFSSSVGLEKVLQVYNNIMFAKCGRRKYNNWINYYIDKYPIDENNEIFLHDRYLVYPPDGSLIGLNQLVKTQPFSLHYNDILYSSIYVYPYYTTLNSWLTNNAEYVIQNNIKTGGRVRCLECGKHYIEETDTMRCPDCTEVYLSKQKEEDFEYCECCGIKIMPSETAISLGHNSGNYVCLDCYLTECFNCAICGKVHLNDNKRIITITNEKGEKEILACCKECSEER